MPPVSSEAFRSSAIAREEMIAIRIRWATIVWMAGRRPSSIHCKSDRNTYADRSAEYDQREC